MEKEYEMYEKMFNDANKIVDVVLAELKGKNAGMEIIKMCVRIALNMAGEEWLDDAHDKERKAIVRRICERTDFDPFAPVMDIVKE